jgi:hypothetical protein
MPAEDEAKARDPCMGQCPDPLEAFLRCTDNRGRPDEFLVKEFEVLLREFQEVADPPGFRGEISDR